MPLPIEFHYMVNELTVFLSSASENHRCLSKPNILPIDLSLPRKILQPWFWEENWLNGESRANEDFLSNKLCFYKSLLARRGQLGITLNYKNSIRELPSDVGLRAIQQIVLLSYGDFNKHLRPRRIVPYQNLLYCNIEKNPFWIYRQTFQKENDCLIMRNAGVIQV